LQLALHLARLPRAVECTDHSRREIDRFARLADATLRTTMRAISGQEWRTSLRAHARLPDHRISTRHTPYEIIATPAPDSVLQTSGTDGRSELVHHTQAFY